MTDETKRIGDYQILDELGSGGMGRVWRVRNVITDRIEAMKVLLPDLAGRQELAARFQREIKLMASLNHPNIAALRTAFTADNQLYMVMEYVEGKSMAEKLELGAIPVPDALNYIGQVLSAVSYAHQQKVIHRDIKPANMMLTPQGVIKLMDFGIARAGEDRSLTMTGTTMGSLSYMSPEQVKGEPTDPRSDLYSVGVSLYEFVTGQRPFVATSDYSIMAAHVKEAPKPPVELHPGLPAELNEIILMSIAKDPARRFQTADAFRNALSSVPVTASPVVSQAALDAPTVTSMQAPVVSASAPVAKPATPVSAPVSAPIPAPSVAKPAVANVPPVPLPPPVQPGGHRGLYMTLGALIVLAGLVVAGIYVPRSSWTHAKSPDASNGTAAQNATEPAPASPTSTNQSTDTASQNAAPSAPSANSVAGNSNSTTQPAPPTTTTASVDSANAMQPHEMPPAAAAVAKSSPATSDSASGRSNHLHARKLTAQDNGMPGEAPKSTPGNEGAAASDTGGNSAQLDELEKTVDQLSNRAAAINSGLDRLQQQQAASGYGLRGDMVEKQASLKSNLYKAEEALQHRDMARAKKYADLAEADAGVLERFLGH